MTAGARLSRAVAHAWAATCGYSWSPCPACGQPFGGHEHSSSNHFDTIPGGEDDPCIICPSCTEAGVGCRAQANAPRPYHHNDCEFVNEIWPGDADDTVPGRSGPYLLAAAVRPAPTPYLRTDEPPPVQPIKTVTAVPATTQAANTRAVRRRTRAAAERAQTITRHRELMRAVPDIDHNRAIRQLLSEHAPVQDPHDPDRLMCTGCAPSEPDTAESEYDARAAAGPCPTWVTIYRLWARSE